VYIAQRTLQNDAIFQAIAEDWLIYSPLFTVNGREKHKINTKTMKEKTKSNLHSRTLEFHNGGSQRRRTVMKNAWQSQA